MNRLANSNSAYLRSAAHQPVAWYEWSEEAFEAARRENKLILLDIGAVWCHWCHVIDRESYEDHAIAQLINASYIPVKVDVDARPDIDRRFQEVIMALTGQGGWPLTVFMTPEGEVVYGGTYFPLEDRFGLPGMKSLLNRVAEFYRTNQAEVVTRAKDLQKKLADHSAGAIRPGELDSRLSEQILHALENHFDAEHGGFGETPKFPPPIALEFLLRRYLATGDARALEMVTKTLDAMAMGGIRDQLGGAFHRYSTDRQWIVPHFEVMLYEQGQLMKIYAQAYQVTRSARYAQVIEQHWAYIKEILSDSARGGFYGSQDADATLHDDGDYWTWTLKEAEAVLDPQELEVAARFYGIGVQGEMRENPAKNVLYETGPVEEKDRLILARAQGKMLAARSQRKAPFIDKSIYVSWNGLMVSGALAAAAATGREEMKVFALKTLDRIWKEAYQPADGLMHVLQESGGHTPGFLEDYAYLAQAFLDAYEITQQPVYLEHARTLADALLSDFWDAQAGGFFDTRQVKDGLAILQQRRKPIQDAPTPAANSVAAAFLARLAHYTSHAPYRDRATQTLRSFAETAASYGLFAASFGNAMQEVMEEPTKITILGKINDQRTQTLVQAALSVYRPNRILEIDSSAEASAGQAKALVCSGTQCTQPVTTPEALKKTLESFGIKGKMASHV